MLISSTNPIFISECFVATKILIEVERWISEVFNIRTSFDTNSISFGKCENSSINRLENLMISFTKNMYSRLKWYHQENMQRSEICLSMRLHIEQFLLLKSCNYIEYNNYWKVLYQNMDISSPTMLFLMIFFCPFSHYPSPNFSLFFGIYI